MNKIAPILCCAVAIVALTAAGFLLSDSGAQPDDGAEVEESTFASYTAESKAEEPTPRIDDEPESAGESRAPSQADADGDFDWDAVDWDQLAQNWEVAEPSEDYDFDDNELDEEHAELSRELAEDQEPSAGPAGSRQTNQRMARIVVVTNFTEATVTVDGDTYPAYSDDGHNRGIEVTPHETHEVFVEYGDNARGYQVQLRPGEERLLMVELTGMSSDRSAEKEKPRRERRSAPDDDEDDEEEGRITVYAQPQGEILIGDQETEENTPGTVDIDPGRHEVKVRYEDGDMSETKTVRVRQGSRVKLFFRQD